MDSAGGVARLAAAYEQYAACYRVEHRPGSTAELRLARARLELAALLMDAGAELPQMVRDQLDRDALVVHNAAAVPRQLVPLAS